DAKEMKRKRIDRIFFAGTPLSQIVQFVKSYRTRGRKSVVRARAKSQAMWSDRTIAKMLTDLKSPSSNNGHAPPTIGVTGPGGAGKTTLIDELVRRYLLANPKSRIAILSHDPSIIGDGALLGDRATMIY